MHNQDSRDTPFYNEMRSLTLFQGFFLSPWLVLHTLSQSPQNISNQLLPLYTKLPMESRIKILEYPI